MSTKQLKAIIFTGLFALPFVPLIVSKSLLFPFITGKAFTFRIIVEVIFFAWLALALKEKEYRPKFSWISVAIFIFLIVIGVADFFGENPAKAFWSNFERMEGFITMIHLGALFLVASSTLKTREIWNKFFTTSVGVSVLMTIYSFFQIAGKITINQGGVRVDGTFGNATYLGIYMVFHIFLACYLLLQARSNTQKYTLTVIAILNVVVLYYTATRGAILGLIGGGIITFLILLIKSEKGDKIRKVALISIVSIFALIGVFLISKNNSFVRNNPVLGRFATLSVAEIKTQGRFYVWPIAWKGFIERPILGWGQEGFNFVFNEYYNPKMYTQEPWFDRTHNIALDWLIAGGALGFLSYLFIFLTLLYSIFKSNRLLTSEKAVFLGMVIAYAFHNLFVFDQIGSYILFFAVLSFIHFNSENTAPASFKNISNKIAVFVNRESALPILSAFVVIIFSATFYFWNFVPWTINKSLMNVLRLGSESKLPSIVEYKAPLARYTLGFSESLEHVSQNAMQIALAPQVDNKMKQEIYDVVEGAFVKQLGDVPNDARYRLFHGLFLNAYGNRAGALKEFEEASKLSPGKQSIYFEIGSNLLSSGDKSGALLAFKKAYELEPSYEEARFVYGLSALATGDDKLATELLGGFSKEKIIFDDRYISVLANLQRYGEIIEIAKERISRDPSNRQHRITLAASYLQSGQRQLAIGTIRDIITLDPTFKEQGEYYISEIQAGRNP